MSGTKASAPSFVAALGQANDKYICTAKGDDVAKVDIRHLLERRLKVPLFQRRYCWSRDQWNQLFDDVCSVIDNGKEKHSLGRITCAIAPQSEGGRILVIDGQQRNTTCTLLLAAIRDVACSHKDAAPLAERLNDVLMPETAQFQSWLTAQQHGQQQSAPVTVQMKEGEALDFVALVPTYCDRAAYFAAALPPQVVTAIVDNAAWQRPLQAKKHFTEKLQGVSVARLEALADTVLTKLEWLFFPIDLSSNYQDGTDNLQVIFERLAIREAMFARPHRASEYVGLGAVDFIRNLLLGSFKDEGVAIAKYQQYWLPIESAAEEIALKQGTSPGTLLETLLESFLRAQPRSVGTTSTAGGSSLVAGGPALKASFVGGPIYPRFRRWLSEAFGEVPEGNVEERTVELMLLLKNFAFEYLADSSSGAKGAHSSRASASGARGGGRAPERRVCRFCRTSCNASAAKCLACGMPFLPPRPSVPETLLEV